MCISPNVIKVSQARCNIPVAVPCNHCYECVRKRKLDWEMRLTVESTAWPNKFFGMLTYNDECYHDDIRHEELSYFIKRLRYNLDKFYPGATLKYFLVSEYGKLKDRLHYHVLYFVSKEFDDTFREFEVLVQLSWVKKVPLTDEEIEFRKNLYKKNRKRLSDDRRHDLLKWSRRKYDDVSCGFATAQALKHGSTVGSIHYACKYIQKQYNNMYYSRMGYRVWLRYMVESGQLVPNYNRRPEDVLDGFAYKYLYQYKGSEYPTFPIRGARYPVPKQWCLNSFGKWYTQKLRKQLADKLFEENSVRSPDMNRLHYFWYKEPERAERLRLKDIDTSASRLHESSCRNDFVMTDIEWETSMTPKHSSPCPVEVESTFPIETLLPLKWHS